MPNTASAKKAVRVIARRTEVNIARKSRVRTFIRRVEEAITAGDSAKAQAALRDMQPELMRAAQKGAMPKRTASRKISRLAHRVKAMAS